MIIGLEGVSCVGKTTLANAVGAWLGDAVIVPCYYHVAPDPSWWPPLNAYTAAEQLANVETLMRLEVLRHRRTVKAVAAGRHVVLDRTIDTVLAHAHAVGLMAGFDCDDAARRLVLSGPIAVPDVTLLLYASHRDVTARAATRVDMPTMLYGRAFTAGFSEHFANNPLTRHCHWVDATVDPDQVAEHATQVVDAFTARRVTA